MAACEAERSAAQKEVETAQSARDLMKWSRRQELVVSGGGGWEPLPQEQEQNLSKLQRIYGRQTVPPVPEIPGWVARAEAGRHALQQVDRYDEMVAACPEENKATAEIQLDRVRHKAEMMDYYDRVMNAQRLDSHRVDEAVAGNSDPGRRKDEQLRGGICFDRGKRLGRLPNGG